MQGTITDEVSRNAGCRLGSGKEAHARGARLHDSSRRFSPAATVASANRASSTGLPVRLAPRWIQHVLSSGVRRTGGSDRGRFRPNLGVAVLIAVATVALPNRADAACVGPATGVDSYWGSGLTIFVDNVCTLWQGRRAADQWCGWPTYANPGDYIDRYWYYCLDEGQYRYLDEGQYNLLGGLNYLLGHPCHLTWYDYHFRSWLVVLERIVRPPEKAGPEYVDFYGEFKIFGEPAQPGDILRAFVAGDDTEPICVGQFIVSVTGWYGDLRVFRDNSSTTAKDGALPGETVTFGAWDKSAGRWYPTEIVYGRPEWTYHKARIRVDVNAIPEPSTISFLGLGVLAVVLRRGQKRHPLAT